GKQSIEMTAPVTQQAESEKIAMTAPVTQEKKDGQWVIAFLMPSKYTLKTIPMPSDPRIKIKQIPGRLMASRTYSGTWSKKRYEENKAKLERDIERRKLRVVGEPIWARYNPPFMPWFLRRNEVLIPVERPAE
ncbi:MAG: heme-binding protein, partial [Desulfoferrobacter sp.]